MTFSQDRAGSPRVGSSLTRREGERDDVVGGGETGARTRKYIPSPLLLSVEMGMWYGLKVTTTTYYLLFPNLKPR